MKFTVFRDEINLSVEQRLQTALRMLLLRLTNLDTALKFFSLIGNLYSSALKQDVGLFPLPEIDFGRDDPELTWINLALGRYVALWFDGDELIMSHSDHGHCANILSPLEEEILNRLLWVQGHWN